jgi:hypothetical protein
MNRRFIANCFIRGFSSARSAVQVVHFMLLKEFCDHGSWQQDCSYLPRSPRVFLRFLPTAFPVATRLPGSVRCREALTDSVPRNF